MKNYSKVKMSSRQLMNSYVMKKLSWMLLKSYRGPNEKLTFWKPNLGKLIGTIIFWMSDSWVLTGQSKLKWQSNYLYRFNSIQTCKQHLTRRDPSCFSELDKFMSYKQNRWQNMKYLWNSKMIIMTCADWRWRCRITLTLTRIWQSWKDGRRAR